MSIFLFSIASVLSFLFVFTTIVFVHEMGHFLAARVLGFKVETFSIGFGKPLLRWMDRYGTQWQIARLPLGGFVKFAGDSGAASVPDTEALKELKQGITENSNAGSVDGIFHFMPLWRRAVVVAAGPVMNFLFAIVIFASFLLVSGKTYRTTTIGAVIAQSPAERAGFQVGDVIMDANGEKVESFRRLVTIVSISANDPIDFTVKRGQQILSITAAPETVNEKDPFGRMANRGFLGIRSIDQILKKQYNLGGAVVEGGKMTQTAIVDQIAFVGRLFRGKGNSEMLGGPLRIFYIAGQVGAGSMDTEVQDNRTFTQRIIGLIWLAGFLSVAIGLINLAPVPMLDGGHLVFYAYEAIAGGPLPERLQIIGFKLGFSAVICLLAFATFNDLRYFNVFGFFGRLVS
ncbi:MAG: site-2 protease family protein [Robiginitomaculum sp.]|nr:site-2 protease family protein [Robiginitomaculum sp.]